MSDKALKLRLDAMKKLLSELEDTIVSPVAKERLLRTPTNHLRDVEVFLADTVMQNLGSAGYALTLAEQSLALVKRLVDKIGPNIQVDIC
jgi:hypothetical protein